MKDINSLKDKLILVVLGRSGSGKGTQARFILQKLGRKNSHYMETGRFLRTLLKKSNPTIRLMRRVLNSGKFVPPWLVSYTWLREIIEKGAAAKHLVFDGAPRKIQEAELLDEVMKWHNRSLPLCLYLDASVGRVTKRLLERGRADDSSVVIRARLQSFTTDSLLVLSYYRKRGRLLRVDGNPPIEEVKAGVERALTKRLGKQWPK